MIDNKKKTIAICFLLLFLLILGGELIISKLRVIKKTSQKVDALYLRISRMSEEWKTRFVSLDEECNFPKPDFDVIKRLLDHARELRLVSLELGVMTPRGQFGEYPFKMEVKGGYRALGEYLGKLESSFVFIKKLTIRPNGGNWDLLRAEIEGSVVVIDD